MAVHVPAPWQERLCGAPELSGYAAKKTRFAEENKNGMRKKGSGSQPFCTARDSRAPANAI